MDIVTALFQNKKANTEKLLQYGFLLQDKSYVFSTEIIDGQFRLTVRITNDDIKTEMLDLATEEPYTLHLVEDACGSFVGAVKAEYERILRSVAEHCFDANVFRETLSCYIISYIRQTYGTELEFLWESSPSTAVFRRADNRKWYGVIFRLSAKKLGLPAERQIEFLDLRADPTLLEQMIDEKSIFRGYHMNKKHWITVLLDGSIPIEKICRMVDESYRLAK